MRGRNGGLVYKIVLMQRFHKRLFVPKAQSSFDCRAKFDILLAVPSFLKAKTTEWRSIMSDKNYSVRKTLRLTPDEAKMLADKSKSACMSEAEYLRLMISQKPKDYPEIRALYKELINEINKIGVNINQIVYNHNCDFYSTDDKLRLVSYLKSINKAIKEVTEKWQ